MPEQGVGEAVVQAREEPRVVAGATFQRILRTADLCAQSSFPVMVTGETGSGKELIARYIHENGNRAAQKFFKINCAALPEHLIESELFGHEAGAFTGAKFVHQGFFEVGGSGTLFLDEIGELPLALQAKLLSVLQEDGEFYRMGSTKIQRSKVRIICGTNVDLVDAVAKKKFREDLYYRIAVILIDVPPLRERKEDIVPLICFVCEKLGFRFEIEDAQTAFEITNDYSWPGNVRELENLVKRASLHADQGGVITASTIIDLFAQLPAHADKVKRAEKLSLHFPSDCLEILKYDDMRLEYVRAVWRTLGNHNQSMFARATGISRKRAISLLEEAGLIEPTRPRKE